MQNVNEHRLSFGVLKIFRYICLIYTAFALLLPAYWGLLWALFWLALAYFLPQLQHFLLSRQWLGPWDYQLLPKHQQRH